MLIIQFRYFRPQIVPGGVHRGRYPGAVRTQTQCFQAITVSTLQRLLSPGGYQFPVCRRWSHDQHLAGIMAGGWYRYLESASIKQYPTCGRVLM